MDATPSAQEISLDRLARNLDIGAEVIRELVPGDPANQLSAVRTSAAGFVRARETSLR